MSRTSIDASLLASNIPSSKVTGTTTNDNAPSGGIGQYIASTVTSGSRTNVAATGVWGNITSISLTAGDWDVTGQIFWAVDGATITSTAGAVSSFSGNTTTDHITGDNATPNLTEGSTGLITLGVCRVSITSTTTIYLKGLINFSAGTPTSFGRISARRVR